MTEYIVRPRQLVAHLRARTMLSPSPRFGRAIGKGFAGENLLIGHPVLASPTLAAGAVVVRISPNNMTSNTTPAPYVISGSSDFGAGLEIFHAFSTGQSWAQLAPPQWLRIDLGSTKTITSYSIQSRIDSLAHQPTAWTLQGSNDNSTWTTVDTRSGIATVAIGTLIGTWAVSGSYRYWLFNWTATLTNAYVDGAAITMYGPP
jgi:F5/8 type C domain